MVMGNPAWENLSPFFEVEENGGFAKTATVLLRSGESRTINGILDAPNQEPELGAFRAITCAYSFLCADNTATGISKGDRLVVANVTFDVLSVEADAAGLSRLMLAEAHT